MSRLQLFLKPTGFSLTSQCSATALDSWSYLRTSYWCWRTLSWKLLVSPCMRLDNPRMDFYNRLLALFLMGRSLRSWHKASQCRYWLVGHLNPLSGQHTCQLSFLVYREGWCAWLTRTVYFACGCRFWWFLFIRRAVRCMELSVCPSLWRSRKTVSYSFLLST